MTVRLRFKNILRERNALSRTGAETLLSVSEYYGVQPRAKAFSEDRQESRADSLEGYRIVKPGDLVMNYMLAWRGAYGVSDYEGIVSPAYSVFEVDQDMVDLRYLHHRIRSRDMQSTFRCNSKGIMESRLRLYPDNLLSIHIDLPTLAEQASIAAFLDRETARIDQLIEKKLKFISLIEEKSRATSAHAITGGTSRRNDINADAPPWLGRIPSHWKTVRIADLFRETVRSADPHLPVLAVSIHTGVSDKELEDEDRARKVNLSEDRTKYQRVKAGDLVYNMMRAWQGAFGTVTVDGLVSPAYVVAEPKAEFRTKFIELQLRTASGAEEVRRYSKGIADFRQRLYWEHFRNLKVCLPPLDEQDAIIAHIEAEQAHLGLLKAKTERSIELLREHRSALITAAVTGKIDRRSAA